jgi:starvation-inducible outer membrane lipoprotein
MCRILHAAIAAAPLFLMSACVAAPRNLELQGSLAPLNNINQLAANDYANHCGEPTGLLKHEMALCRAVPLIRVPLQ